MIEKIQLINITTHKNSTITFKPGINSLMGDNGAGKSTVLQMIGYVLFDYLPGKNMKQYVRIGASENFGEVKLWILARDGEEYLIHRTIGKKKNEFSITHTQTSLKLKEINSLSSFHEWVHTMLGIRKDLHLKAIFENGIGVRQGTFTEPFLRAPSGRAEIFAPLLNVDVYSQLFKNFLPTLREIQEKIQSTKNQKSGLEGELSIMPELLAKKKTYSQKVVKISSDLKQLTSEWSKIHGEFDKLEKLSEEIKKSQKEIEIKQEKINGLQDMNSELQKKMQEAQTAEKICKENQEGFIKYIQLEKDFKEIGQKLHAWFQIKDKLAIEERKLATLQSKYNQITDEINEIEALKKEIPNLEQSYKHFCTLTTNAEEIRIKLDRINEFERQIQKIDQELSQYKKISIAWQNAQKKYEEISNLLDQIQDIEEESNKVRINIHIRRNQISELKMFVEQANSGVCPLCDQPYHNPVKDLPTYLQEKINNHLAAIEKLTKTLESHRKTLKNKPKLQKEKEEIVTLISKYKEQLSQLEQKRKEKGELEQKTSQKVQLQSKLKDILTKQEPLKQDSERYNFVSLKVEKELVQKQAQAYQVSQEIIQITKTTNKLLEDVKKGDNLEDIQIKIQESMDSLRPHYEQYQKYQQQAATLPENRKKFLENQKFLTEAQIQLKSLNESFLEKSKVFDQRKYDELKEKLDHVQTMLIQKEEEKKHLNQEMLEINSKLTKMYEKEKKLKELSAKLDHLEEIENFCEQLRIWFKEAGPKITEALISSINQTATAIFCQIKNNTNYIIEWQEDYDVILRSEKISQRRFSQLSGGEQMVVALAIRLSILKILTQIDFAFFDEPTTNLDEETRRNLAQSIQNIHGFEQIFVISHDDTFEEYAHHIIRLSKNDEEITQVE
ncbi:MAG: AAA family ATPase [Promethearchaeota archaeon]